MSTTTDLATLKINYLTQAQYEDAISQGIVNENELYLTPASGSGVTDVEVDGTSVVTGGVAEITMPTVPTKVSDLTNDSGFLTAAVTSFNGNTGAVTYTAPVTSVNGNTGAVTVSVPTITDTYSGTSSNGMSGKAVKSAIDALDGTVTGSAGSGKTLTAFSQTDGKVSATFGNISITKSQVSDFPSIPTKVSDLTNDSGYITGYTETDPVFSASAAAGISATDISNWNGKSDFSGSYNDLTNKPTIPTVNNATLTIQKNGSTVKTFTANASSNVTANITVPTKVSDLTNDSGYITGYTETDPVFSASAASGITSSNISTWNGKYAKPSGGIPKTDLASAVQTSLGLADTALQSFTETDPTVPSWAKQASKPTYTASEVGALPSSTAIPSKTSDLTNDSGFITGVTSTSTPTSDTIAEFDNDAHMNSTDMTAQEVSDFVDSLNPSAIEVESKTYTNMSALRSGNVVTIKIAGTASASASGWYSLGTLDAQFRPSATVFGVCYNNDDNTWNAARPIIVQIGAGGGVSVWLQPDKLSLAPRGVITYVTAA